MRKQMLLVVLVFLVLFASGCGATVQAVNESAIEAEQPEPSENDRFDLTEIDSKKYIITDKESNVQYLKIYRNGGFDGGVAIQVLLDEDGNPYVSTHESELKTRFTMEELDKKHLLLTDQITGVQYLIVYRNGGFDGGLDITPLYKDKGLPITKD